MKILGIACSPRKRQTSYIALRKCFDSIEQQDKTIKTEIIELSNYEIKSCIACNKCKNGLLCAQNDGFMTILPKLIEPDVSGIIISTPVYMGSMTSQCKAFLDRTVMLRRNDFLWKNKVAGVIAVGHSRNGGQELTIKTVQSSLLIHDMILVGDGKPTAHFGGTVFSGIDPDDTGDVLLKNLGLRVLEVMKLISQK